MTFQTHKMSVIAFALASWSTLHATPTHAYLLDLSEAAVAPHGELEVELQPLGYLGTFFDGEASHTLVVPSLNVVAGLGSRFDVTLTTRGLLELDHLNPPRARFGLGQQGLMFRVLLADGGYSSGNGNDPSIALQFGSYLPDINGEAGFAPSVALLGSQVLGEASAHLHVELILTDQREREVFVSAVLSAPDSWVIQLMAEAWVSVREDVLTVSGLVGAIAHVTDDLAIEAGMRLAGFERISEVEGRLTLAFSTRWLPRPHASSVP